MKYCTLCKGKYDDGVSFCPVDGEVLEDDPSSIVDTVLDGQYQIEALLGKGGMGAVYRARHILLGDRVAIKILPREMRSNAEWLRRFQREGQAARRFRHPNSVTVYDLRTAGDGMIYMVMEYVDGHTLDAELKKRGRFSPAEALAVLEPVMSVLNAAHEMGVVHRDLKPENIMIGKASTGGEPTVKLLDLGIAKLREVAGSDVGKSTALTMAGQMLGTPYYMSPEQWGELPPDGNSEIDGRADIYSLALVFYEMIAGRKPYSAITLLELRKEHVSGTPRRLDEVLPDVPAAFSAAIARAMAKDRSERPGTASEFLAQLKAALGTGDHSTAGVTAKPFVGVDSEPYHRKSLETRADVNAPTIITMDVGSASITQPNADGESLVPPLEAPAPAVPAAEISSITLQSARPPVAAATLVEASPVVSAPEVAKPSGRRSVFPVVAAVLALVVVLGGVGGFLLISWRNDKTPDSPAGNKNSTGSANTSEPSTAVKEVAQYWLEVLPDPSGTATARVSPTVPLASGQSFKFHFVLTIDGYVYIVGPGERNQPTTFLTTKPVALSGLVTNQAAKGSDFSFPNGADNWLTLDKKPGTEDYTIVVSPRRLDSPAFLNIEAGHALTSSEQSEWTSFLAKNQADSAAVQVNDTNGKEPLVRVKIPSAPAAGEVIIINVRIEHK